MPRTQDVSRRYRGRKVSRRNALRFALGRKSVFEELESRRMLTNFVVLADSLDQQLVTMQDRLTSALDNFRTGSTSSIPIIGDQLGNAARVVDSFRFQLQQGLESLGAAATPTDLQIQTALAGALSSLLSGAGIGGVHVSHTGASTTVEMLLQGSVNLASVNIDFDTGLPGLPFQVMANGRIEVSVGYALDLSFSIDASGGVSLNEGGSLSGVTAPDGAHPLLNTNNSLALFVSAQPSSDFAAKVAFGFVEGTATPISGSPNGFFGTALVSHLLSSPTVQLDGNADANLRLAGSFAGTNDDFPGISADFHLHWGISSAAPALNPPTVAFDNVSLTFGTFISNALKPALKPIKDVIQPLRPVFDLLGAKAPGISDLSEAAGAGPITILDLAVAAGQVTGNGPLADLLAKIENVLARIDSLQLGPNISLPLGGFDLASASNGDLRGLQIAGDVLNGDLSSLSSLDPANLTALAQTAAQSYQSLVAGLGVDQATKDQLNSFVQFPAANGFQLKFPILDDPASVVFNMLLGRDSDLFYLQADATLQLNGSQASGLSFAGLPINFVGTADVDTHFKIGYDTFGLRELIKNLAAGDFSHVLSDITDGVYVSADSFFKIAGSIRAEAGSNIPGNIVSYSVAGGIFTQDAGHLPVQFYIDDPNLDGKLRPSEFDTTINGRHFGFQSTGVLSAELFVTVGIQGTPADKTFDVLHQDLVLFTTPTPQRLASQPDANGQITLYLGVNAGSRTDAGGTDTGSEYFTIEHLGDSAGGGEDVKISAFGMKQVIKGVKKMLAVDLVGTLTIVVAPGITSDVDFTGGSGSAELTYLGSGHAKMTAGALASYLTGGGGVNELYGGVGDDTITLGSGANTVDAAGGHNTIIVNAPIFQNATVSGGDNSDNHLIVQLRPTTAAVSFVPQGTAFDLGIQNSLAATVVHLIMTHFTDILVGGAFGDTHFSIGDLAGAGVSLITMQLLTPLHSGRVIDIDTSATNSPANVTLRDVSGPVADPFHPSTTLNLHSAEIVNSTSLTKIRLLGLHDHDTLALHHHGGSLDIGTLPFNSGLISIDAAARGVGQAESVNLLMPARTDGHMVVLQQGRSARIVYTDYADILLTGSAAGDSFNVDVSAPTAGATTIDIDAMSVHGDFTWHMLGALAAVNHVALSRADRDTNFSIFGQSTTTDFQLATGNLAYIRHDVFASNVQLAVKNGASTINNILWVTATTFGNWVIPNLAGVTPHLTFSGLRSAMTVDAGAGDNFQLEQTPLSISSLSITNNHFSVQDLVYATNWMVPLSLTGNFSFFAGRRLHRDGTVERVKHLDQLHSAVTLAFQGSDPSQTVFDGDADPAGAVYTLIDGSFIANTTVGLSVSITGYRAIDTVYIYLPGGTVNSVFSGAGLDHIYIDGRARLQGTNPNAPNVINAQLLFVGDVALTPEGTYDSRLNLVGSNQVFIQGSLPLDDLEISAPTKIRMASNAIGGNQTRFDYSLNPGPTTFFELPTPTMHQTIAWMSHYPITGFVDFSIMNVDWPGNKAYSTFQFPSLSASERLKINDGFANDTILENFTKLFTFRIGTYPTNYEDIWMVVRYYPQNANPTPGDNTFTVDGSQLRGKLGYQVGEPNYALAESLASGLWRASGAPVTNFTQTYVTVSKTNAELASTFTGTIPVTTTHYNNLVPFVDGAVSRWPATQVTIGTGDISTIEGNLTVNQAWLKNVDDRNGAIANIITMGAASTTWTSASGAHPILAYTNLQGSYTFTGGANDRFDVEGTPNSAYRTIINNFSTSTTPADVYVMAKNVMPLEVSGNFNLLVGDRLNADGSVTAVGRINGVINHASAFVPTGGRLTAGFGGTLFWQDFQLVPSSFTITPPITYNGSYGFGGDQSPLPILFNYAGPAHGSFVFDASNETITDNLFNGVVGPSVLGISTNLNYPGKANLRFYDAQVVYGPGIDVTWYGAKLRTNNTFTPGSTPTLLDNPLAGVIHYIANLTNTGLVPIEQILIGNVLGPVVVEGSGRTTRVELNPVYSFPTPGTDGNLPGWGAGHTGSYSLIDTVHAPVTVSNAALRVIADIPLPNGSPAVSSRPNVVLASNHITGIAGATINFSNLQDSTFNGLAFFGSLTDLNRSKLPGLNVQLPAHAAVDTTVENTPGGVTTHISTVLSSSNTTFTDGLLTVLGTTGPLLLGEQFGPLNINTPGVQINWPTTGGATFTASWSDGISVTQINIGNQGSLANVLGPILLKGDSHFTSATVTTIDGRSDTARSNVRFTAVSTTVSAFPTETSTVYLDQIDGLTSSTIYFSNRFQLAQSLSVYGSPNSSYTVNAAPQGMKLYAGQGSSVLSTWPAMSIIGADTVRLQLADFYQIDGINFNSTPARVPEISVEQDPAHPHVVDLTFDPGTAFSLPAIRLENAGGGLMRTKLTNVGLPDSWHVNFLGSDVHATLNYGSITIADTGAAGTVASSKTSAITVLGTTYPLQILPTGAGTTNANVTLGSNGSLQALLGNIEFTPNTAIGLTLDDRNDTTHRDVHSLTDVDGSTLITGYAPASFRVFTENSNITLYGSGGGTTFYVDSQLYPLTKKFFNINGVTTSDLVVAPNFPSNYKIFDTDSAFLNSNVVVRNIRNLRGGTADDAFIFGPGFNTTGLIRGNIDGGDGTDSLLYDTRISVNLGAVNLPAHTAPLVNGQVLNFEQSGSFTNLFFVSNPGTISVQVDGPMTPRTISAAGGFGAKQYSATGLPNGITINPSTGVISGTTSVLNYSANVVVTVIDNSGSTSIGFTFNTLPGLYITTVANQTTGVNNAVNLPVQANYVYGGTLSYSATNLPTGLTINPQTGVITGTVAESALGNSPFHVTVNVTDGTRSASVQFDWTVLRILTIINPGNQLTPENVPIRLPIQVTNPTGAVTYSATNLPSFLSINSQTGVISGSIANYWYYYHQNFSFNVTVFATDSQRTVSTSFTWRTEPGFVPSGASDRNDPVGTQLAIGVNAYDPFNGGAFTYDVTGLPPGITWNPATRQYSGTLDTFADQGSPYHPVVTFTNTVFNYSYPMTFEWIVTPNIVVANPGPQLNRIGDQVDLTMTLARDLGLPVSYSASGLPRGLVLDEHTGHITGTVEAQDSAPYDQTTYVTANDGVHFHSIQFQWQVIPNASNFIVIADTDHGGVITLESPVGTTLSASYIAGIYEPKVGTVFPSGVVQIRVDGIGIGGSTTVTMTPSSTRAWESFYNLGSQPNGDYGWYQFLYQVTTDANDASTTGAVFLPNGQIVLHLVDGGRGDNDFQNLDGGVTLLGGPVVTQLAIESLGDQYVSESDVIDLPVVAVNGQGPYSFSATNLPTGLSIDAQSGHITGTVLPENVYPGYFDSVVQVSDGTSDFSIHVGWYIYWQQTGVVVFPNPSGTGTIELSFPASASISSASLSPTPPSDAPSGFSFPVGFISFAVYTGEIPTIDVTITGIDTSNIGSYLKYGPTPGDGNSHWYEFLYNPANEHLEGMEIVGSSIVLHLRDGGYGDDDITANGFITDPGGPAIVSAGSQPTTTQLVSDHAVSAVYGEAVHFSASVSAASGTPTGSVQFQVDGTNFGSPQTLASGAAGIDVSGLFATTHSITAVYSSDSNAYSGSSQGLSQLVTPAPITVTADAKTKVYGAAVPALTFTTSALVNDDTIATAFTGSLATTAAATSNVGSYPITQGTLAAANYAITYVGANVSVTQAPVTVTADAKTKVYGAAVPALTFTTSSLVNDDTIATAFTGALATTATATSNVGNYPITQGTLAAANYAITYVGANVSVTQAPVTVTADAKTKVYGAAVPALTFTTSSLVNGDTIATAFTGGLATTATATSNVGSYPITQGTLAAANYAITYVGANVSVTQAPVTVTADAKTKVYGAAVPALTFTTSALVNGDTIATAFTGSLSTTGTISSSVASYPISQGTLASANYAITYVGANLSVTQSPVIVTVDAQTKLFGAAVPSLTFTTSALYVMDSIASAFTGALATSATSSSNVGSYPITQGTLSAINYAITFVGANLSVTQAPVTVTADAKTKVYGAAMPALTFTTSSLVNGDTVATAFTGGLTTTATQSSSVGNYPITQGTLSATNYAITFVGANLSVTQAPLTITADAKTKTYGAPVPTLTFTTSAFANGDTAAVLSGNLATTATSASNVGSYPITQGTLAAANYAITFVGANLSVTQASVTVTADAKTKVYGAALPALTFTTSAFVNGDTAATAFTGALASTATSASNVGSYPITQGSLAAANYAITYVGASLSVTQAALTITADNKTRTQGTANPPLTYTASGFVNGDTVSVLTTQPLLSTTATTSSSVGDYPITASGAAAANYSISYVSGTLSVTASTGDTVTTLSAATNPSVPGQSVAFTVRVTPVSGAGTPTGAVTIKEGTTVLATLTLSSGQATFSTAALKLGVHSLVAVYAGAGNYTGSSSTTFTQTIKTVVVEPDVLDASKNAIFIGGTPGNDTINIKLGSSNNTLQVDVKESNLDKYRYSGATSLANVARIVIFGGDGNDILQSADQVTLPTILDGGAGNDALLSGGGNDILLGQAGVDVLKGNIGRDLLIGGTDQDLLAAGKGQAVLIGGTTDYDQNLAALATIMQEWSRTDLAYDARVAHLLTGGGANGSLLLSTATVHDDHAADILTGGSDLDLFFAAVNDVMLNQNNKEKVVRL